MGRGDVFDYYAYDSDDGQSYVVKLSADEAANGGFGSSIAPKSAPFYPYGSKNMRHVWGVASDGSRGRLKVKAPDSSIFQSDAAFTLGGVSYVTTGATGERRPLSSLGG